MIKKILIFATIFGISFSVDISVPNDYDTIQEAIDASINGDRIILGATDSDGSAIIKYYDENIVIDNKDIIIGSKYLTTGDEDYINKTRIRGYSDIGPTVTFKNTISNEAGLIGIQVIQRLVYGGC